jgi:hypothetical protein
MEFTKFNQRINAAEPEPRARAKAGGREIAKRELAGVLDETHRWFPRQCRLGHFFAGLREPQTPAAVGATPPAERFPGAQGSS